MDTNLPSDEVSRGVDLPEAVRELNRMLTSTGAHLQATQIILGALLARLHQRRALTADFAATARAMVENAPRMGEPFDTAFGDAISVILSQIEPPGGGKPRRPKPKLTLIKED